MTAGINVAATCATSIRAKPADRSHARTEIPSFKYAVKCKNVQGCESDHTNATTLVYNDAEVRLNATRYSGYACASEKITNIDGLRMLSTVESNNSS
jgi:hypothetical protein